MKAPLWLCVMCDKCLEASWCPAKGINHPVRSFVTVFCSRVDREQGRIIGSEGWNLGPIGLRRTFAGAFTSSITFCLQKSDGYLNPEFGKGSGIPKLV